MKYAIFSHYQPIHRDKIMERAAIFQKDKKENPDKYPKQIFESHNLGGGTKAIQIVEATYDQLLNLRDCWMPYNTFEWVPLYSSPKLAEKYPTTKF